MNEILLYTSLGVTIARNTGVSCNIPCAHFLVETWALQAQHLAAELVFLRGPNTADTSAACRAYVCSTETHVATAENFGLSDDYALPLSDRGALCRWRSTAWSRRCREAARPADFFCPLVEKKKEKKNRPPVLLLHEEKEEERAFVGRRGAHGDARPRGAARGGPVLPRRRAREGKPRCLQTLETSCAGMSTSPTNLASPDQLLQKLGNQDYSEFIL